jgi:hypothetical protein
MRSLIPFCSKELVNFGLSINHHWRIIYDFRFVRYLFERINPHLANIRTEKGGPAIPIRLTNFNRFIPLGINLVDHFVGKASTKLLRRRLSLSETDHYPTYPLSAWKMATLRWAKAENLLNLDKMHSGAIYNPTELSELVEQGLAGNHQFGEFLDRVITIEMALRTTGASLV